MKILFINPPLSDKEKIESKGSLFRKAKKKLKGEFPPLGLASLAAFLIEKGHEAEIIDSIAQGFSEKDIIHHIKKSRPDVIGFSSMTYNSHRAMKLAETIKKEFSWILTLCGGHHPTTMQDNLRLESSFDFFISGEGEYTLFELIEKYRKSGKNIKDFKKDYAVLEKIDGILYNKKGKIVSTKARKLIENLDELPFPARELFDNDLYLPPPSQYKRRPLFHMVAFRGCSFSCTFCSNNSVFGKVIRSRSPEKIIDEIKYLKKQYGAKEIAFWDDTITTNRKWLIEFCKLLISSKLNILWSCYSRVDTVSLEILKLMKKAGCWNIFYGYESGNQELLDIIKKGITLDQIRMTNAWTKKAGIEIRASFMLALPGETPQMGRKTIEFAKELNPHYAQFCITTPYPGTELYSIAEKYGKLDYTFSKYSIWNPVFIPYGYKNAKEVTDMEKQAVKEFYLRPSYIISSLARIRSVDDISRYLDASKYILNLFR